MASFFKSEAQRVKTLCEGSCAFFICVNLNVDLSICNSGGASHLSKDPSFGHKNVLFFVFSCCPACVKQTEILETRTKHLMMRKL